MTTVGANVESQSAEITQTGTKSHLWLESSNKITKDEWLISIENFKVDETKKKPQFERVPSLLCSREPYQSCIAPSVVSIGPYYHGGFKAFEKLKIPIARKFCHVNGVSIEDLYEEVAKVGKSARECYEEYTTYWYDDEAFNRMMFLDACFVGYFMYIGQEKPYSIRLNKADKELERSFYPVLRDLFLLENQIPLLVLAVLMEYVFGQKKYYIIEQFLELYSAVLSPMGNSRFTVKKFLAMIGCSSESDQERKRPELDFNTSPHLLHLMREQLIQPVKREINNQTFFFESKSNFRESNSQESYRSVTDLQSAGIFLKPSQTGSFTDVEFKSGLIFGTLTLHPIKVDHITKPLLLNLVAYEMCHHGPSDYRITSYICLMDALIDHADDVKELRKERILINKLGSDELLAQFFNTIANDLVPEPRVYEDARSWIDNHCKYKRHIWMAEWIHKYFSSPWTLLALIGALSILGLTIAQTIFAAIQSS